jgi:hypothetical protein
VGLNRSLKHGCHVLSSTTCSIKHRVATWQRATRCMQTGSDNAAPSLISDRSRSQKEEHTVSMKTCWFWISSRLAADLHMQPAMAVYLSPPSPLLSVHQELFIMWLHTEITQGACECPWTLKIVQKKPRQAQIPVFHPVVILYYFPMPSCLSFHLVRFCNVFPLHQTRGQNNKIWGLWHKPF